ncbi:unnamed protein product [Bursaphelenchus xylophilus]|uniref:(pine wood nematode) hypothetical protein n=1 Tax=Bursaphelenchus xylophilus TaxID=6326 RepID=A0A1I7RZ41_BURXY|nr:unnamed protein product [Bursaphelenchus xylophilus]CAG9106880.1 unnamed protein product [Bursaphelenchus xylophilus]
MKTAHTWHHSHNVAALVRDAKASMTAEKTLEKAREYLAKLESNVNLGGINEEKRRKISGFISNLCTELEKKRKNGEGDNSAYSTVSPGNNADLMYGIRSRAKSDPSRRFTMGSQIFSTYTSNLSLTDSEHDTDDGYNASRESEETVKIEEIYDRQMPWALRLIPHILFFASLLVSVYGGALFLQLIDPAMAKAPLVRVVLNCFDGGARLGWGQQTPTSSWGRVFVSVYSIYTVGLINGFMATIGSIITDIYCVHWPVLMAKIKGKDPKVNEIGHVMSLKVLLYFNVCMIIIGWYIWCYQFEQMTLVDATYSSVMTMMAAAFGDVHPDPKSHFQLMVLILYYLIGIAIWGGILVILSSYVEIYYIGKIREFLRYLWVKYRIRRERQKEVKNCCDYNCHNNAA